MHCVGVDNPRLIIASKMPKVRFLNHEARTSISSCQNFISLNIVVYTLFAVDGVFPKDSDTDHYMGINAPVAILFLKLNPIIQQIDHKWKENPCKSMIVFSGAKVTIQM